MTNELTPDAFAAWARAVGLKASAEHLEILRPEVEAMLARIAPLDDIDASGIAIEDAIGGSG